MGAYSHLSHILFLRRGRRSPYPAPCRVDEDQGTDLCVASRSLCLRWRGVVQPHWARSDAGRHHDSFIGDNGRVVVAR